MIIGTVAQAAELLAPFFSSSRNEAVTVLHLGQQQQLIAVTVEAPGRRDEVELPIASILSNALRLGAAAIVIAHNHPSGDPTPSSADEAATRALAGAAAAVELRLHDHLVFGDGAYRSFRSLGLL